MWASDQQGLARTLYDSRIAPAAKPIRYTSHIHPERYAICLLPGAGTADHAAKIDRRTEADNRKRRIKNAVRASFWLLRTGRRCAVDRHENDDRGKQSNLEHRVCVDVLQGCEKQHTEQ